MAARELQEDVRGKVVLRMRGSAASPLILEVATRFARTFRGELHGLFVENEELLALAQMPFAREISLTGGHSRALSVDVVRKEMEAASAAMEREFERLTRVARIPARFEVVAGAAEEVLRKAMEGIGILAIGEPLALAAPGMFPELLAELTGITGIVVVGCEARRAHGPILTVIDPESDVAMIVDTAEQIAGEGVQEVILLIASAQRSEAERLEAEARAALDAGTHYRFERIGAVTPQALGALAQRHEGGLVIARIGGPVAESGVQASSFACALDCPLLLLR
jgi:hypothetical protein